MDYLPYIPLDRSQKRRMKETWSLGFSLPKMSETFDSLSSIRKSIVIATESMFPSSSGHKLPLVGVVACHKLFAFASVVSFTLAHRQV